MSYIEGELLKKTAPFCMSGVKLILRIKIVQGLNLITLTLSWTTSGVALLLASDRIKYTFITSLVHITYMLQLEGEC